MHLKTAFNKSLRNVVWSQDEYMETYLTRVDEITDAEGGIGTHTARKFPAQYLCFLRFQIWNLRSFRSGPLNLRLRNRNLIYIRVLVQKFGRWFLVGRQKWLITPNKISTPFLRTSIVQTIQVAPKSECHYMHNAKQRNRVHKIDIECTKENAAQCHTKALR